MKIVTSGAVYIDIDAYAGCVAYAELLELQGYKAIAASTVPLNESITSTIRSWQAPFHIDIAPSDDDTFILIDVSDPGHFDTIVDLTKVEQIIDHHPGSEEY